MLEVIVDQRYVVKVNISHGKRTGGGGGGYEDSERNCTTLSPITN